MKRYEIELDEAVSNFFEEIAMIVKRPLLLTYLQKSKKIYKNAKKSSQITCRI